MVNNKTPIQIYSKLTNTPQKEVELHFSKFSTLYGKLNPIEGYCKLEKDGKSTYLTISPQSNSKVNFVIGSDYKKENLENLIKILEKIKN